jgi:hypothetical protein
MERHFRWRQGKDKPTVTGVHGLKPEDIAKERPIRFGVSAVMVEMPNLHVTASVAGAKDMISTPRD